MEEQSQGAVREAGDPAGARRHVQEQVEIPATAEQRVCAMRYPASSNATKEYTIHPYRLVHAHGGMYVLAWVPTLHRDRNVCRRAHSEAGAPGAALRVIQAELSADAFGHSLGVNRGTPEKIPMMFAPQIREYVRERNWHKSQKLQDLPDGSLRMTLNVCADAALCARGSSASARS